MPRLPRVSPAAAIGLALAALACVFTFVPFFDFDTWWHLRTGEHIVTQLKIPDQDLYSHTVPGPWVNHQWLAQVVYYLVDQAFGLTGIRVLNSAAAGACAWLLWRLYLKGTGALLPALFAISLILPDFLGRFNHRPEMFSLPLTVALVSLLIATPGPLALTPRRLAALAGIAILWANLHAMAVTGVIFLAAYAGGEVATLMVRPWFDPGEWGGVTRRSTLWLVGATAAVAVAVLLTPIRGEIYAYVMHSRDHLIEGPLQIAEWRPSLGVLAAISGQVARSGASWVPVELAFRFLYLAIPIGFFVAVPYLASRRELPSFGGLLLAVVTIYMGVSAVRLRWMFFVPIFYIARALALAIRSTLEARSPEEDNKGGRTIANLVIIPGMVMFIAIGLYTVTRADVSLRKDYHDETYPIGSATFLNELDIGGNLFNPYNWGGYLIYRVTPRYKVFIDGRTIHYTSHPNVVRDYIAIERQTAGFEKLLDLYNVDVIAQSRRDYFPRGLMAAEMSFARKPSPETSHATANAQAAINAAVIAVPAAVTRRRQYSDRAQRGWRWRGRRAFPGDGRGSLPRASGHAVARRGRARRALDPAARQPGGRHLPVRPPVGSGAHRAGRRVLQQARDRVVAPGRAGSGGAAAPEPAGGGAVPRHAGCALGDAPARRRGRRGEAGRGAPAVGADAVHARPLP